MPFYHCLKIHSSPRMMVLCIMIIVALLWSPKASAFLTTTNPRHPWIWNSSSSMSKSNIKLSALSERQIQVSSSTSSSTVLKVFKKLCYGLRGSHIFIFGMSLVLLRLYDSIYVTTYIHSVLGRCRRYVITIMLYGILYQVLY